LKKMCAVQKRAYSGVVLGFISFLLVTVAVLRYLFD